MRGIAVVVVALVALGAAPVPAALSAAERPLVSISTVAYEATEGGAAARLEVRRRGDTSTPLTVRLRAVANGADLVAPASVIVPAGERAATFSVRARNDDEAEYSERGAVAIEPHPDYRISSQFADGFALYDNEPTQVSLDASDPIAAERPRDPDPGYATAVVRGRQLTRPLRYTVGGTAGAADRDVGEASFADDHTFEVMPIDDLDIEDVETVTLTLDESDDYELTSPEATIHLNDDDPAIVRLWGEWAEYTAWEVANELFSDCNGESCTVVLARSDLPTDGLAAAPLAGLLGAPVLLTQPHVLANPAAWWLEGNAPGTVVIVGGPAAISPDVEEQLADDHEVIRLEGGDRFATAAAIARYVCAHGGDCGAVYVVEGDDPDPTRGWPDAVAVSGLAALQRRPILLAETSALPAPTAQVLDEVDPATATIVGGPVAVADSVRARLLQYVDDVDRLSGDTRYATSLAIADRSIAAGASARQVVVATGRNFADALIGGAAAAEVGGVLLLVDGLDAAANSGAASWLGSHADVRRVWLLGGVGAVTDDVAAALRGAMPEHALELPARWVDMHVSIDVERSPDDRAVWATVRRCWDGDEALALPGSHHGFVASVLDVDGQVIADDRDPFPRPAVETIDVFLPGACSVWSARWDLRVDSWLFAHEPGLLERYQREPSPTPPGTYRFEVRHDAWPFPVVVSEPFAIS